MLSSKLREEIKEAAKWLNVTQVATQFKVSRNVVIAIKKGIEPKKGLEWESKRKEIAALAETMPVKEVAAKFGLSQNRIYDVLKRENGHGKRKAAAD